MSNYKQDFEQSITEEQQAQNASLEEGAWYTFTKKTQGRLDCVANRKMFEEYLVDARPFTFTQLEWALENSDILDRLSVKTDDQLKSNLKGLAREIAVQENLPPRAEKYLLFNSAEQLKVRLAENNRRVELRRLSVPELKKLAGASNIKRVELPAEFTAERIKTMDRFELRKIIRIYGSPLIDKRLKGQS